MIGEARIHVFIVEDDEIYAMMLDYILSKDSIYKFSSFNSGEECLENLWQNPDAVILDYELPGINGYQVLQEIKKRDPEIHVLMLSSKKNPELVERLLEAGADDYLLKQDHPEKQITEKIELLLNTDENTASLKTKAKQFKRFIYVLLAISIGVVSAMFFKLL